MLFITLDIMTINKESSHNMGIARRYWRKAVINESLENAEKCFSGEKTLYIQLLGNFRGEPL